jgi:hypothetical protein
MARHEGGHRLASVVENFLTVDNQNAVAVHEILDFLAKAQRMDIAIFGVFVGTRRVALGHFAIRKLLAPALEAIGADFPGQPLQNLLQHHFAIADDGDIDVTCRGGDLLHIHIDARDRRLAAEARWRTPARCRRPCWRVRC